MGAGTKVRTGNAHGGQSGTVRSAAYRVDFRNESCSPRGLFCKAYHGPYRKDSIFHIAVLFNHFNLNHGDRKAGIDFLRNLLHPIHTAGAALLRKIPDVVDEMGGFHAPLKGEKMIKALHPLGLLRGFVIGQVLVKFNAQPLGVDQSAFGSSGVAVDTVDTRGTRQQLTQLLGWYQGILNQQDPLLVARASSRMEKILEQIESALEIGGLPEEPFFNEDGELEDDTL